jgi:type VI secretion system ImpB/VipA family protein
MGVLGDYSGHRKEAPPKLKEVDRKFVQIDRDNFDEVLKGMAPRLAMKVDNKLVNDDSQLGVELNFECLADFEPQNVAKQVAPLNKLVAARQRLSELRNKMAGNDKLEALLDDIVQDTESCSRSANPAAMTRQGSEMSAEQHMVASPLAAEQQASSLLDSIIEQSRVASSDSERSHARDLIAELAEQVLEGSVTVSRDLSASLDARIAEIDALISDQLNAIMHHADFQQLEASWRGLNYLVKSSETSTQLKLKVLNVTKKELVKDFKAASEFDQSALFKKIYEDEYGTFGGAPYAALVGDFEFTRHPEDFYLLEELSHVAAAAHAPLISAAAPGLFGLESFPTSASRVIWPKFSTPSNTPSGSPSASRKIPAMSAWFCRTYWVVFLMAATMCRWSSSILKKTWMAPITTNTYAPMPPTPMRHA